jgi:parallel beta-helix repeat protein
LDESSKGNTIVNNTIKGNEKGIYLFGENNIVSGNAVIANTVSNNTVGISLLFSKDNIIYHNNFVDNSNHVYAFHSVDMWDYNGEGNYWSDYEGEDLNDDSIGDAPYLINEDNQDNYPLMGSLSFFSVDWQGETYPVLVISNSTVLAFSFTQESKSISLTFSCLETALSFSRISLPVVLLGGPYTVIVDDSQFPSFVHTSNGTHTFFYITLVQGAYTIKINGTTAIPELSQFTVIFLLAILLLAVLFQRLKFENCVRPSTTSN